MVEAWDIDSIDDEDLLALDGNFGINSSDEACLLALATEKEDQRGMKRKGTPLQDDRAPKTLKGPDTVLSALAGEILHDKFGLQSFRLKQAQAIERLLRGENAVVVFPTGGGKSLCYQLPALAFAEIDKLDQIREVEGSGITLVVSPLISLMKDQTDALLRRGIKAATLDSTKSREEYLKTCDMMRDGELRILYVAPERLNNEGFVAQIATVRGGVRMVAVDEAHCISEWGHAFRPDYLKVARFIKEIKAERVVCLTATATDRVAKDICSAFNVPENGLFRTSTYRPNLHLLAESAETKTGLYPRLFAFLRKNPGSTIVYVTIQKQTEELSAKLRSQGFNAKPFHAGMDPTTKQQTQNAFMKDDTLIIVATIAFGMGIDKANIRNVVHFNIPSSLESYSQEIGRAGRDGMLSRCMFYVCGEDLHLREVFARGDLPRRQSVVDLLHDIFNADGSKFTVGSTMEVAHWDQERDYDIRSTTLKNIYAQLELRFGLLRAVTPKYTKYMFKPGMTYQKKIMTNKSPAAMAIRNSASGSGKGGRKVTWWTLDVDLAASSSKVPRESIVRKLQELNETSVIELKVSGVLNVYKVLKKLPSVPSEIDEIANELFGLMEVREKEALERTDQVLSLITDNKCFSLALAQHFGDLLPGNRDECGHCTWCITHEAVKKQEPPQIPFNKTALAAVFQEVDLAFKKHLPDHQLQDDPQLLARIAFGISSPRVAALKLSRAAVFGSMDDHPFLAILTFCKLACKMPDWRASFQ